MLKDWLAVCLPVAPPPLWHHNQSLSLLFLALTFILFTVEPPIKDTPNKEHLSIKDKSTCYFTSTF